MCKKTFYILTAFLLLISGKAQAQSWGATVITEFQYTPNGNKTHWVNYLRLDGSLPIFRNGEIMASTIHAWDFRKDRILDDYQVFSNIDEVRLGIGIARLGYAHHWKNARVFVGVHTLDDNFFTASGLSNFTGSSHGIVPTISENYAIATFPASSLGVFARVNHGDWYAQADVFNGGGYSGWKKADNPFIIKPRTDGVFMATELGYMKGKNHYLVGAAAHTRALIRDSLGDIAGFNMQNKFTASFWIYGQHEVWHSNRAGLSLLALASQNTWKESECTNYLQLGAIFTHERLGDVGLSIQRAKYHDGAEWATELNYTKSVTPWLTVCPAMHVIHNNIMGTGVAFLAKFTIELPT